MRAFEATMFAAQRGAPWGLQQRPSSHLVPLQ